MSNIIYGVTDHNGIHTDVSRTLRGAKNYATRHNFTKVSSRNVNHYHVVMEAEKKNGKWVSLN